MREISTMNNKKTILYHSPYEFMLSFMLLNNNLSEFDIYIDDIDPIGINKSIDYKEYELTTMMNYSKTKRTNVRPLSINIPTHSITNLRSANWKKLDSYTPIKKLKEPVYTVEKFIQHYSRKYSVRCFVSPDTPSYFLNTDTKFWALILRVRNEIKDHIEKTFQLILNEEQLYRLELLFPLESKSSNISLYFIEILYGISNYLNKPIIAKSYIELLKNKDWTKDDCFMSFAHKSGKHIRAYNESAAIQQSKKLTENEMPYFCINSNNGKKEPLTYDNINHIIHDPDIIISPKVLTINEFCSLIIPHFISDAKSIEARMFLQKALNLQTNYHSIEFNWISSLINYFDPVFHLSEDERMFWGFNKKLSLSQIIEIHKNDVLLNGKLTSKDEIFSQFVRIASYNDLNTNFYPWVFFITNGELFAKNNI